MIKEPLVNTLYEKFWFSLIYSGGGGGGVHANSFLILVS